MTKSWSTAKVKYWVLKWQEIVNVLRPRDKNLNKKHIYFAVAEAFICLNWLAIFLDRFELKGEIAKNAIEWDELVSYVNDLLSKFQKLWPSLPQRSTRRLPNKQCVWGTCLTLEFMKHKGDVKCSRFLCRKTKIPSPTTKKGIRSELIRNLLVWSLLRKMSLWISFPVVNVKTFLFVLTGQFDSHIFKTGGLIF